MLEIIRKLQVLVVLPFFPPEVQYKRHALEVQYQELLGRFFDNDNPLLYTDSGHYVLDRLRKRGKHGLDLIIIHCEEDALLMDHDEKSEDTGKRMSRPILVERLHMEHPFTPCIICDRQATVDWSGRGILPIDLPVLLPYFEQQVMNVLAAKQ